MGVYLYPSNTETPLKEAYIGIPSPTSIVLNKSSISLTTVGQTEQLTATIEPTISDHSITWSSDDTTVATVSTTGLVTCVTPGTCTITATTVNGLTASCSVSDAAWQPGANTIAYYPLTSSSTVNDESPNGNNGTLNGTITFGSGLGGVDCGTFSGNGGSYITVPHSSDFATTSITYSLRAASQDYNGNRGIIYKGALNGGNGVYCLANYNNIDWRIGDTLHSYTGFSGNNVWTHIVVTFDGTAGTVYANGTLLGTFNQTANISTDTNNLIIGAYWSSSYCFKGYLSNIIVENKIRTATDVSDYFNQTKSLYGVS